MRTFKCQIWYRYNAGDDKDFFIRDIAAETEDEATEIAKKIRPNIYKVEILC